MVVKSAQVWTGSFATADSTGALLASTSAPTAVLYVNGVSNAAAVTVTGSNPYKWSVTLPALTAGDTVEIYASATIATIPVSQYVAAATADTSRPSDVYARIGAPAGASVSADVLQIKNYVDDIGAAGAGLTALPWNAAWDAEVQSEATDALNAYDPPTNAEMEARTLPTASYFDPATDTVTPSGGTINSVFGTVSANVTQINGNSDPVDNLVLALGNSSGVMISNAAVDAVWNEPISGHLTAGTTGAKLNTASSASGSGSTAYTDTVTDDSSNPLDGVEVWITSDSGGASTVASTTTSTLGAFTVYLDPGTYYLWLAKGGYNFPNPTTITVS